MPYMRLGVLPRRIFIRNSSDKMIEYRKTGGGISLVTEKIENAQSACIGVWVGAGSCCENRENYGISHVIEHMFFKGTKKRNALRIAKDTDDLGANINAFTGKEATCYHIKALTEVFPKACDILFDMLVNSLFDPSELRKEKNVILEELHMVEDTPEDYVVDLLTGRVFFGTPLQSPVIGTARAIKAVTHDSIKDYINSWYKKDNLVVSVVGNFDEKKLERQIDAYLSGIDENSPEKPEIKPRRAPGFAARAKDVSQSHIALGMETVSSDSPDYYAQAIVNDVLGGSMSSRLFQNIREQQGLAYTVYSYPMSYNSKGMYFIYAAVGFGKERQAVDAIASELESLGRSGLTDRDIATVKQRLKSGFIFSQEKMETRMYALGKNRLLLGRNYTPEETMAEISAVSADQVNSYCRRISNISGYCGASISREKLDIKRLIG